MSKPRESLFKMLTAFSYDEIDEEFVDRDSFKRIETVLKTLSGNNGVKRKSERKFLGTVHHETFTGADFLHALQRILCITETEEALNLGKILLQYGYIFLADSNTTSPSMKEDGTLYRFQNSKFWPSQKPNGSEEEYAIYLQKKILSKGKDGLRQHEMAYFEKLHELFGSRWKFVVKEAKEQCRALQEKKKTEKNLVDKEEEYFWRVHRPMEDKMNVFDAGQKRFLNRCSRKVDSLKERTTLARISSSIAINNLSSHCEQFAKVDALLDSKNNASLTSCWLKDFMPRTLALNLHRLERWSISLLQLLSDAKGVEQFELFLKKEYSDENLKFWLDCENLRYAPKSMIENRVIRIYRDFMAPGARFEINVDNKAISMIRDGIRNPSVHAFDLAQSQIFNLMNTDSYPRFLKSQQYKDLIEVAKQDKTTKARKSNNRLLNAARALVGNQKEHRKLGRSSSDFLSKGDGRSGSFNTTTWHLQPNLASERSCSENDLTKIDDFSQPTSPMQPRASNRMKLKGLPILKLSRSITPGGTPGGTPGDSPSHSGPASRSESPLASPCTSRNKFDFRRDSGQKSAPLAVNELNEKLSLVKLKREDETNDDITDWQWQKVSHDFF